MIDWEIQADEFVSCNCAYGCPCQFNALPTNGNCQAVGGFSISNGYFADTKLDGLKSVGILSWPGPIHEGGGKAFMIIDETATPAQREALITIMSGEHTEPGATMWNVFASTMEEIFKPVFKHIDLEINIEQRIGKLHVEDLVESIGEPITNPVTGDVHRARIDLPHGFEYKIAEMGSATTKTNGPITLSFDDSYAQFAHIHLNNQGIVRH